MRKIRSKPLIEYLESVGALATGNDEVIRKAKKDYRGKYYTAYRAERRRKGLEILLSISEENRKRFLSSARYHRMKLPAFIVNSANAYLDGRYIVPDRETVATIQTLLYQLQEDIRKLASRKSWFGSPQSDLTDLIAKLEREVMNRLLHPKKEGQ